MIRQWDQTLNIIFITGLPEYMEEGYEVNALHYLIKSVKEVKIQQVLSRVVDKSKKGEAQKIALARALYKDTPFSILDEPTAAIDPIAEFEVYTKFNELVGDKTTRYISHRLSSCRFCDKIVVFHEGRIIEEGTHETLSNKESGKYQELWDAQAQYYAS